MNEIWKDIDGYEGLYQVSNLGQVKSIRDKYGNYREKILKQGKRKDGYLYVNLYKEGKRKYNLVHRLVANAFIPNPNGYTCVNHKDENPLNNCVSNLEWCTHKYNINYGSRTTKAAEKLTNRQDLSKQVYQYDKQGTLVAIWDSTMECKRNGYNQGHVAACCRGERKTHRGFKWSYTPINPK